MLVQMNFAISNPLAIRRMASNGITGSAQFAAGAEAGATTGNQANPPIFQVQPHPLQLDNWPKPSAGRENTHTHSVIIAAPSRTAGPSDLQAQTASAAAEQRRRQQQQQQPQGGPDAHKAYRHERSQSSASCSSEERERQAHVATPQEPPQAPSSSRGGKRRCSTRRTWSSSSTIASAPAGLSPPLQSPGEMQDPDWQPHPPSFSTGPAASSRPVATSSMRSAASASSSRNGSTGTDMSLDDTKPSDPKPKTTRTRIPSDKRKMQNRLNQRAFRARREQHFKDLAVEDENLHQLVSDQRTEISNLKDVILGLQSELAASRAAEAGTSDKLASALGFSCAPSDSRQLVATRTRSHSAANGGTFQSQRQSPTPSLSSSTMTLDTSVSQSGPETYAQSLHSGRQQMNTEAPAFVKYPQPGASLNDGFATCQTLPAEDGDQSGFTLWQPQTIPPLFDLQAQAFAYPVPPPYSSLSEANKLNLIGQPITPQGY